MYIMYVLIRVVYILFLSKAGLFMYYFIRKTVLYYLHIKRDCFYIISALSRAYKLIYYFIG